MTVSKRKRLSPSSRFRRRLAQERILWVDDLAVQRREGSRALPPVQRRRVCPEAGLAVDSVSCNVSLMAIIKVFGPYRLAAE